ncbi:triose-phosphate isomerase [Streptococcus zalophi]|uniref:triose-phosphate isomerase n=1 Tax=Streptococcus zalophi TaxID=640031 RepID=UPI00215CE2CB|nr:triose-phosphate isomerase [Streptococcus zalophi]MCR8967002.1 triose-phosphate isomerase [Streptococcus zalophi]
MIMKNFFVFNPKSYLYGQKLYDLAELADQLVTEDISIFVTGPYSDLAEIKRRTKHIIVTAQHMDGINPGRGMGMVSPNSLHNIGVGAVFLNHAEKPMSLKELINAIKKAKDLDIKTIVCADSVEEAKAIAILKPDIILCEPTDLIGTGKSSDSIYIKETTEAIKTINPEILVMQAAGISSPTDVYQVIKSGADGTGCTSGIVNAKSPQQMFIDMISAFKKAL